MLKLLFLVQICVVDALPSSMALSTSFVDSAIVASSPTPPPKVHDDLKRDSLGFNEVTMQVDDNMCGWVNGNMRRVRDICGSHVLISRRCCIQL